MTRRNYKYSDDELIQYAYNTLGHLEQDLPDFMAFDASLGTAKRDEMMVLAEKTLNEGGDEINVSKLGDLTEKVLEELNTSRKLYHNLRYWVMKAFANRKAVQRQFGIGRFRKIASSQAEMIGFMHGLVQSVTDYRTELEAGGAPPQLLDLVAVQADKLNIANQNQENKKGNKSVDTEQRIMDLNELFQHTKDYNSAAEFVYYDSPAKRDRYRPPSNVEPADDEPEEL